MNRPWSVSTKRRVNGLAHIPQEVYGWDKHMASLTAYRAEQWCTNIAQSQWPATRAQHPTIRQTHCATSVMATMATSQQMLSCGARASHALKTIQTAEGARRSVVCFPFSVHWIPYTEFSYVEFRIWQNIYPPDYDFIRLLLSWWTEHTYNVLDCLHM